MLKYIVFTIFGFWLLMKGSDYLIDGAILIAKKFGIPTIIIGLTIVAIGTSMPELMVSTMSSLTGHSDISIGNIIGSNMVNLFLILGICAIIKPLKFKNETEKFENIIAIVVTIILAFIGNNGTECVISRYEGVVLLTGCILFIINNIKKSKEERENYILEHEKISIVKALFSITLGTAALKIGGDVVVKYSSEIARICGFSEKIISITIIAFSTSLPELITSVNATLKGDTDMAIGNILGSQIFNILLIIGISSILSPIQYSTEYNIDFIFLIAGTILFAAFPFVGKRHYMTKLNGIIFVFIYAFYIWINIIRAI